MTWDAVKRKEEMTSRSTMFYCSRGAAGGSFWYFDAASRNHMGR